MCYYNTVLRIVFLAAFYFKCVFGECPDNQIGECKLPMECDTLPFLKDIHRTREQTNYLRESGCGTFQGLTQMICCPFPENLKKCQMASGVKGVCKDARNCTVLQSLTFIEALNFLTPSCNGTSEGSVSVCCPTTPVQFETGPPTQPTLPTWTVVQSTPASTPTSTSKAVSRGSCEAAFLPPDSDSGCCGKHGSSPRILGGSETGIDQYPWLVLLEYRNIELGFLATKCSGSLISGRYVLTAAHCVDEHITNLPESVRLGEHDTRQDIDCDKEDTEKCNNGSVSIPIENIIKNELYLCVKPFDNDIALVRLNRTVNFSDFIKPICLPTRSEALPSRLVVAGWGRTDTGKASHVKMHVAVPFVNLTTCNLAYPRLRLQHTQTCAGGEIGRDSCKGDSGGPLMHFKGTHYELLGIVSFGKKRCHLGYPGVYTKVTEYIDWISINMRES